MTRKDPKKALMDAAMEFVRAGETPSARALAVASSWPRGCPSLACMMVFFQSMICA